MRPHSSNVCYPLKMETTASGGFWPGAKVRPTRLTDGFRCKNLTFQAQMWFGYYEGPLFRFQPTRQMSASSSCLGPLRVAYRQGY
jgi:hypothetical protein